MRKILDSNILLDYPAIVENPKDELIISLSVLRELDGLKKHVNPEVSFSARRAAVYISRNMNDLTWDEEERTGPVDDQLLELTRETDGTLVTNDVYLKVKAKLAGLPVEGYKQKDDYEGVAYWYVNTQETTEEITQMLEKGTVPDGVTLTEGQYLIAKDLSIPIVLNSGEPDYELLQVFIYRKGKLECVQGAPIRNQYIDYIKPRNPEQICLFDMLNNTKNTICSVGGRFGSGKSFVVNNYALQQLDSEKISKIVYVPNNSYVANSMELGFLPGSSFEKLTPSIGPIIDLIGIDRVERYLAEEKIEIVPIGFMRGRSFKDAIVICDEAQNLTEEHVKLLIARCGEGTRIIFMGDIAQADSQLFKNKNGLKLLLSLRKSPVYSKMFSAINLKTTERSLTAQAAEYLSEIEIQ